MSGLSHEADLVRAVRQIHGRLEDALRKDEQAGVGASEIGFALVGLATFLEGWCHVASLQRRKSMDLTFRGERLYDPLDLLKDARARAAFQLRILAEESRAIRGSIHQSEYLERVRALLLGLHEPRATA